MQKSLLKVAMFAVSAADIIDRTNYQEGGRATELAEEYAKLLRRMAPSPTDRSLPQFLIQGGFDKSQHFFLLCKVSQSCFNIQVAYISS